MSRILDRVRVGVICLAQGILYFNVEGQGVGINTTGLLPGPSAGLDINFSDRGLLIPRVSLTNVNNPSPVNTPAISLLVYNTNPNVTGGCGVGFYYWNGSQWVCFLNATGNGGNSPAWLISGNTGTNPSVNFIGTVDNQPLVIRTIIMRGRCS